MGNRFESYCSALGRVIGETTATDADGTALPVAEAISLAIRQLARVRDGDAKVMFIGNGGSAGIASHMAIDYLKNGGVSAMAFNDGAALTCLGNDLGFDEIFAQQVAAHGRAGDLLFAISSSGRSADILRGVAAARQRHCTVVTLSGFRDDNPLRRLGDINFYLASDQYGFVELGHNTIIHAILDLFMGWSGRISATADIALPLEI